MIGWLDHGDYLKWKKRLAEPKASLDFLAKVKILVVGGGSIGKRHLGNLAGIGVKHLSIVEPREDRRGEIAERFGDIAVYASEEEAYAAEKFDGVVVANPTAFHIASGEKAIAHGAHVLMEKAISDREAGVAEFLKRADDAGKLVFVGYTYRFSDTLQRIDQLVRDGALGKVFSSEITFSEWLPGWHPWENSKTWYMGRKELGGGELFDENHTIDFARWIFGEIESVSAFVGRVGDVTLDTDDLSKLICVHESGTVTSIHLDALGRKPRKEMWVTGEKGTIYWDSYMTTNRVELYRPEEKRTEIYPSSMVRNDMFVDQVWHFLELMEKGGTPIVDGWDALKTLKVCTAAIQSSEEGKRVLLA
ncbi:Gfo/Idh/MocA family oxidoreductase [Patescibacteria group bacterium]|nr:Gfo/Idh/MocA family oxidoreductase [Patescibacteria group bacterium]